MIATTKSLFDLTASDLMSRAVVLLRENMPLRDAAAELSRSGVHGAPVVDADGKCVGVLSVSDLARWAVLKDRPPLAQPRTCSHQDPYRALDGDETTICTLPEGACSFQTPKQLPDGRSVQACREPNSVCLEWQMVEMETLPVEDVRHYMTSEPVTIDLQLPIRAIAQRMLDAGVRRVIVIDPNDRPIGVVSATDIVAAVAACCED